MVNWTSKGLKRSFRETNRFGKTLPQTIEKILKMITFLRLKILVTNWPREAKDVTGSCSTDLFYPSRAKVFIYSFYVILLFPGTGFPGSKRQKWTKPPQPAISLIDHFFYWTNPSGNRQLPWSHVSFSRGMVGPIYDLDHGLGELYALANFEPDRKNQWALIGMERHTNQ